MDFIPLKIYIFKKYYKDTLLNSILFSHFISFISNEDICGYIYYIIDRFKTLDILTG